MAHRGRVVEAPLSPRYAQLSKLGLQPDDAAKLAALAAGARSLVRVKVADDNDIAQMLECCRELVSFFGDLEAFATTKGVSAFKVFQQFDV